MINSAGSLLCLPTMLFSLNIWYCKISWERQYQYSNYISTMCRPAINTNHLQATHPFPLLSLQHYTNMEVFMLAQWWIYCYFLLAISTINWPSFDNTPWLWVVFVWHDFLRGLMWVITFLARHLKLFSSSSGKHYWKLPCLVSCL